MANNWFSNLLPAIENAAKNVGNKVSSFSPGQVAANVIPNGQAIAQGLGVQLPTIGQIGQNLQNQNTIASHAEDAPIKQGQGITPTAQDVANRNAGVSQMTNQMVAGHLGDIGETGTLPKIGEPDMTPTTAKGGPVPGSQKYVRVGQGPIGRTGPPSQKGTLELQTTPTDASSSQFAVEGNGSEPYTPPQVAPPKAPAKPTTPYPDVPTEPVAVGKRTSTNPVTGGNPVIVDLRNQAGKNPYYLDDMNKAQQVLDKYVPGNTAQEVEANLPKKLTEETQRIQNIIGSDPKTIPVSDLIKNNEINMQKAGLPQDNVTGNAATNDLIVELNKQLNAGNENPVPIVDASGNDLLKYKNLLDNRLKSAYKKIDNGTTLTPTENATLTFRRTIDDALSGPKGIYPATKDALNRQSAMIDARESVANAAGAEQKSQIAEANKPTAWQQFQGQSPLKKIGEVGGALAGGTYIGSKVLPLIGAAVGLAKPAENALAGALGYAPQDNAQSPENQKQSSNSQTMSHNGMVPDVNGNYNLPVQTSGSSTYMTNAARQQVEAGLTPGTPQYTKIEQKYADDQKKATEQLPNNTTSFMDNAPTYMKDINQTNKDLKTMPLDFLHGIDSAQKWAAYTSNPSNPYAAQLANLGKLNADYINSYSAVNGSFPEAMKSSLIAPGDSTEQAKEKWSNILNFVNNSYTKYQDPYLAVSTPAGYQTPTGNGNVKTPGATIPTQAPQNVDMSTPSNFLPPITQGIQ